MSMTPPQPYNQAVSITKSDTANIIGPFGRVLTDAVYVGGAGILVAVFENDTTQQFTCVAGQTLPISIKRVNSASTTATLMLALYCQ